MRLMEHGKRALFDQDDAGLGWLKTSLVSALVRIPMNRLREWHCEDIAPALKWPGGDRWPRAYTWRDYARVRVVQKLIDGGALPRDLAAQADRFECIIGWTQAIHPDYREAPIVPISARGGDYLVVEPPRGPVNPARERFLRSRAADPAGLAPHLGILAELQREGPLASLSRFDGWITMTPDTQSGRPRIIGTRITTRMVADRLPDDPSPAEIAETADDFTVRECDIAAALDFQRALRSQVARRS